MRKTPTKSKFTKYMFIDTSALIDVLSSDHSSETLNEVLTSLNASEFILVLPEVIQKEIERNFRFWIKEFLDSFTNKFSAESVLSLTDNDKTGSKNSNSKKKQNNTILIEKITTKSRMQLINSVEKYYKNLEKTLTKIFNHRNTRIVKISDEIILAGIRRSLVNKAPSTKLDKKTEGQHLKDVDCIAFESILSLFNNTIIGIDDELNIITTDSDYTADDPSLLSGEMIIDLSMFQEKKVKYFQSIESIFSGGEVHKRKSPGTTSLEDINEDLIDSSENNYYLSA